MNVLVLDDEIEIADLVEVYLKSENFKVFKSYNSRQALDIFDKENIDLAILDVMVDDISGFDIVKQIRERGGKFPIIMLTAKIANQDNFVHDPSSLHSFNHKAQNVVAYAHLTFELCGNFGRRGKLHQHIVAGQMLARDFGLNGIFELARAAAPLFRRHFAIGSDKRLKTFHQRLFAVGILLVGQDIKDFVIIHTPSLRSMTHSYMGKDATMKKIFSRSVDYITSFRFWQAF